MTENSTVATRIMSADDLRKIKSFADFGSYVQDHSIPVIDASDVLGDGFELTKDKDSLVGKRFVIVDYRFTESDTQVDPNTGDPSVFATVRLITEDDRKLIINDGSTGIRDQLRVLPPEAAGSVIMVRGGLRVSEYEVEVPTKSGGTIKQPAKTYYLSV